MKNLTKSILLSSVLVVSSTCALAAPYVSGQLGSYGYGDNNVFENTFDNEDGHGVTGRLAAGYRWDISEILKIGVEAGINGYQNKNIDAGLIDVSLKRFSTDALGVLTVYPTSKFNLFAKGGAAYVRQKLSVSGSMFRLNVREDNIVPKAAVGVGYDICPNINVNLSLNHEFNRDKMVTFVSDTNPMVKVTGPSINTGATSVLAGIQYTFN